MSTKKKKIICRGNKWIKKYGYYDKLGHFILHREDGPALINYRWLYNYDYKRNIPHVLSERFFTDGKFRDRKVGPSEIQYYDNGNIRNIYYFARYVMDYAWFTDEPTHPNYVSFYRTGEINEVSYIGEYVAPGEYREVSYYENGNIAEKCDPFLPGDHAKNLDIPWLVRYYPDGQISEECWESDDGSHRAGDLPAITTYHKNGQVKSEEWWINGDQHRLHAPAEIHYSKTGKITRVRFWINDDVPPKDVQSKMKKQWEFDRQFNKQLEDVLS